MRVDPVEPPASAELDGYIRSAWHAAFVVAHGERIRPAALPGFIARDGDRITGHAAYRIGDGACEVVAIIVERRHAGIGSALLVRVVQAARAAGCARVWLTTTNDNVDALRFYQRRGFQLSGLRPGVLTEARRDLKPDLPLTAPTGSRCATSSTSSCGCRVCPIGLRARAGIGILRTA